MPQPSLVVIFLPVVILLVTACFLLLLLILQSQFDLIPKLNSVSNSGSDTGFGMKSTTRPSHIFGLDFDSAFSIHLHPLGLTKMLSKFNGSPDLTHTLKQLATYCIENGKHEVALKIFKALYSFNVDLLGPENPETLATLDNLAGLNFMLKRFDTSLSFFWQLYKIQEKVHGKSHSDTLATLKKLALIYQKKGNYTKAAGFYKVIYKRKKNLLGPEHVEAVQILHLWANLLRDADQSQSQSPKSIEKVLKYYKKVYEVYSKTLGENNDRTLAVLSEWENCLVSSKKYEEAVSLIQKSVQAAKERQEPDVATENLLAFLLMQLGRLEGARAVFETIARRHTKIEKKEVEEEKEEIDMDKILFEDQINTALNLAKAVIAQENTDNETAVIALEKLEKLEVYSMIESDHPRALEVLQSLMKIYNVLGNSAKAFQMSIQIFSATQNKTESASEPKSKSETSYLNRNQKLARAWETVFDHFLIILKKHPNLDPEEERLLPLFFVVADFVALDLGLVYVKSLASGNPQSTFDPEILRAFTLASIVSAEQKPPSNVITQLIHFLEKKREQEPKPSEKELKRIDKEIKLFRKMTQ